MLLRRLNRGVRLFGSLLLVGDRPGFVALRYGRRCDALPVSVTLCS